MHDTIAMEMTQRTTIDAGDVDAILLHGLQGSSQSSLAEANLRNQHG